MSRQLRRRVQDQRRVSLNAGLRARFVEQETIRLLKGERLLLKLRIAELESGQLASHGVTVVLNQKEET